MEWCRAECSGLCKPEQGNGQAETWVGSRQPAGKLPTLSQWEKLPELCRVLGME